MASKYRHPFISIDAVGRFLILSILSLPSTAAATGGVPEGNGSEETPYLVADYADLKVVGTSSYSLSAVYRLTADIDASPSAHERGDSGFTPIGNQLAMFQGKFHGHGHTIKNLTIRRDSLVYIGLFGYVKNCIIDTLGLQVNGVSGRYYTGALLGYCDSSTVTCCYTSGTVNGKNVTGGCIGLARKSRIQNCYSTGLVTGTTEAGGIVGRSIRSDITSCYSIVTVAPSGGPYSSMSYAGALVGLNDTGSISNSYWNLLLSGCDSWSGLSRAEVGGAESLTLEQMKRPAGFPDWDFTNAWVIRSDSTFPGLRKLDNPPFAVNDTFRMAALTGPVLRFCDNDADIESGRSNLVFRLERVSAGSFDAATFTAPPGTDLATGFVGKIWYRVGEVRPSKNDTLWGTMGEVYVTYGDVELAGSGTAAEPFIVNSYAKLKRVGTSERYLPRSVYSLANDIDARVSQIDDNGAGFPPIGTRYRPFSGTFNGNGYTIRNLTINRPKADSVGLFGVIDTGNVGNLYLVNCSVTGRQRVGALAGHFYRGKVQACFTTGSVSGNGPVGGLVGEIQYGKIDRCYSTCNVVGKWQTGGLAGLSVSGGLTYCYAGGDVTGKTDIAGLTGQNGGSVYQCYSTGLVRGNFNLWGCVRGSSPNIGECFWNVDACNLPSDGCTGLTSGQMRQAASFTNWNFDTVWTIAAGNSCPGLRSMDNAPFAFNDSVKMTSPTFALSSLLENDYDIETGRANLVFKVLSVSAGTTDSLTTYTLPAGTGPESDFTGSLRYRLGEVRGAKIDTLWGNCASVYITCGGKEMAGSGTAADPFIIRTYTHLKLVGTSPRYPLSSVYRLGADIDAAPSRSENNGEGFTPIGNQFIPFTGRFHGGGHIIRDLRVTKRPNGYNGLFGYVRATIDSVRLENNYVFGEFQSGGLAGYCIASTISYCRANGTVEGIDGTTTTNETFGGLVGRTDSSMLRYCSSGGLVSCASGGTNGGVGGLVGMNWQGAINNCYSTATVIHRGKNGYTKYGGLAGFTYDSPVNNCFATGDVISDSVVTTAWTYDIGGLIGLSLGTINNCFATGLVTGGHRIGGLVGDNSYTITDCYSTGDVTSDSIVGGLLGENSDPVINCYEIGRIPDKIIHAGGKLIGYTMGQAVSCYYNDDRNKDISGIGVVMSDPAPKPSITTGLTATQFKQQSSFPSWNFDTIWTIRPGLTCPGLRSVDNAPFAFADTLAAWRGPYHLNHLLANDCDIETGGDMLVVRIKKHNLVVTDSVSTLSFPETAVHGAVDTIAYRVGEARPLLGDTLWGNRSTAIVRLDTTLVPLGARPTPPALPEKNAFSVAQSHSSLLLRFDLPDASVVNIKLFTVNGRCIATPVCGRQPAGRHRYRWDASRTADGVYLFSMTAGNYRAVRIVRITR